MGIKTFLASLIMLITIAAMCAPLYLIWYGLTMNGSVLVRIGLIIVGLILCRLFKPISNLFDKDFKWFWQMQEVLSFPRNLRHPADYTNTCHRLLNGRATLVLCIFWLIVLPHQAIHAALCWCNIVAGAYKKKSRTWRIILKRQGTRYSWKTKFVRLFLMAGCIIKCKDMY